MVEFCSFCGGEIQDGFDWCSQCQRKKNGKIATGNSAGPLLILIALGAAALGVILLVANSIDRTPMTLAEIQNSDMSPQRKIRELNKLAKTHERKVSQITREIEDRKAERHGFVCLSAIDGTHPELVTLVKAQLRNPRSFQHIETKTAVAVGGYNPISMRFRAENGFGGMTESVATGSFSNSTCKLLRYELE